MATVQHACILFRIFAFTCFILGVHCLSLRGHIQTSSTLQEEHRTLETLAHRQFRRGAESNQEHCGLFSAPWMEINIPSAKWGHLYRLKILPMSKEVSRRPVFPEQPLFRFVRRVYRCCQEGYQCGSVKGLQGRDVGGSSIEFLFNEDVLSATIARAEIHLHISNPENLNIQPLLPSLEKRELPTRYRSLTKDHVVELRVDLMFVFQALQRFHGGRSTVYRSVKLPRVGGRTWPWTLEALEDPPSPRDTAPPAQGEVKANEWAQHALQAAVELGLALHCSTAHTHPCERHGVQLLHTPFITLSYR